MSQSESRHALRIACRLPVQLRAKKQTLVGTMLDVSRSGCRIRVHVDLSTSRRIGYLARAHDVLGRNITGALRHDVLGNLVSKRMTIVRALPLEDLSEIDIACRFETPLTDEEATMSGLGLPALGVTEESAYRKLVGPRRRSASRVRTEDGHLFEATLTSQTNHRVDPLVATTDGMQGRRARLLADLVGPLAGSDAETLLEALARAYGPRPQLEILDGSRVVWNGAVLIEGVFVGSEASVRIDVSQSNEPVST